MAPWQAWLSMHAPMWPLDPKYPAHPASQADLIAATKSCVPKINHSVSDLMVEP